MELTLVSQSWWHLWINPRSINWPWPLTSFVNVNRSIFPFVTKQKHSCTFYWRIFRHPGVCSFSRILSQNLQKLQWLTFEDFGVLNEIVRKIHGNMNIPGHNLLLSPSADQRYFLDLIHFGDQSKLLCTISNNIEVYEEPVRGAKKTHHCAVKFEAGEENRIAHESLYCFKNISWCHGDFWIRPYSVVKGWEKIMTFSSLS